MSIFTLVILCLTTSNLLSFMDLHIPGSYAILFFTALNFNFYTRQTLLSPQTQPHLSIVFTLAQLSGPSFFLELLVIALCSSPVAHWTPSNLRGSSSGVIPFCLFILFMVFSQQKYWRGLPFPLPVDHILSELFTIDPSILGVPAMHGLWLYWVMQALSPWQYYNPWRVMEKLKGTQLETKDLSSTPIPGLYPHHT